MAISQPVARRSFVTTYGSPSVRSLLTRSGSSVTNVAALKTRRFPMPWRCPACHIQIRHSEIEEQPLTGQTYRCHICRLDLMLDARTQKLAVAPFEDDHAHSDSRTKPTK
jgi:hypothetical protein